MVHPAGATPLAPEIARRLGQALEWVDPANDLHLVSWFAHSTYTWCWQILTEYCAGSKVGHMESIGRRALSRRTMLGLAAATAISPVISTTAGGTANAAVDELTQARTQWRELLVRLGYDPADPPIAAALTRIADEAQRWWSAMVKSAGRTYLWPDARLDVQQSFAIRDSYVRLKDMALAWATPGCRLAADAALLADTVAGLDWMYANWYNETRAEVGNWYEWKISGPRALNDATVILFDRLTSAQVQAYGRATAKHTPGPLYTAANRALTSHVVVGRGVLTGDATTVQSGVDGLPPVLAYVSTSDGFYADGSFIQHEVYPYAGSYGASILNALGPLLQTVHGTQWQASGDVVAEWLANAFDPLLWRGAFMDMTMGRVISRPDEQGDVMGHYTMWAALGLLDAVSTARRPAMASMVKEWLLSDAYPDSSPAPGIPTLLAARALVGDSTVPRRGALVTSKVYRNQDRIVHRRAGWALAIAARSSRIATFEYLNGENVRGWVTSDGATYLYIGPGPHYGDAFWPTVNSARIPGTTVDVRSRGTGEGNGVLSAVNWAGGASLDSRWTAAGMNLDGQGSSLTAKKSWLCFDRAVIALGAAITASDGRRVETTVENRQISAAGTERLLVNGVERVASNGWTEEPQTRWVHIGGTGGYVFPTATLVDFRREARTGKWTDINTHPTYAGYTQSLTRNYLSAWIDHGSNPSGATYAYVLLPTATPEETEAYAAAPDVEVVANTPAVQAARWLPGGVLAANFWTGGSASILTSQDPGSVVLSQESGEIAVAVADPTHRAAQVRLKVAATATRIVSADPGITVNSLSPLTFTVNVSGAAGATKTLRVAT